MDAFTTKPRSKSKSFFLNHLSLLMDAFSTKFTFSFYLNDSPLATLISTVTFYRGLFQGQQFSRYVLDRNSRVGRVRQIKHWATYSQLALLTVNGKWVQKYLALFRSHFPICSLVVWSTDVVSLYLKKSSFSPCSKDCLNLLNLVQSSKRVDKESIKRLKLMLPLRGCYFRCLLILSCPLSIDFCGSLVWKSGIGSPCISWFLFGNRA